MTHGHGRAGLSLAWIKKRDKRRRVAELGVRGATAVQSTEQRVGDGPGKEGKEEEDEDEWCGRWLDVCPLPLPIPVEGTAP